MKQQIINAYEDYSGIEAYLKDNCIEKALLLCDKSLNFLSVSKFLAKLEEECGVKFYRFDQIEPNPSYETVEKCVRFYLESSCDAIFAVGGGSVIDVAKCVKLFSNMDHSKNYLEQEIVPNGTPLLVLPTTAGTGSETTRYAVIYYKGEKQSITHESIIPSTVVFDPSVLDTLPLYQKKATLMDALCHSIESFWSVNSTEESKEYSKEAISLIMDNKDEYLSSNNKNEIMLRAAYLAGKAINITQTTAGHAMCYKLSGLYGISHGHAVALCISDLWEYMSENLQECVDPRGEEYVLSTFSEIAEALGCSDVKSATAKLRSIVAELELSPPEIKSSQDIEILKNSVNPVRIKNNPVRLSPEAIENLYRKILRSQI